MASCSWPLRAESTVDGDDWSLRAVDKVCQHHIAACQRASAGVRSFGMAVDKYNAHSLELTNACIVLPNNVGFEAIPQARVFR